jgi:hypothetical protein
MVILFLRNKVLQNKEGRGKVMIFSVTTLSMLLSVQLTSQQNGSYCDWKHPVSKLPPNGKRSKKWRQSEKPA